MNFSNQKKTYLSKLDKSKKGSIDEKIKELLSVINSKNEYYTTSSCSGRVVLLSCNGKKNETEWLKVSHDLIGEEFFELEKVDKSQELIWLRVEPLILHICCKDLNCANELLETAKLIYKKSCLLSFQNKIILEIRGSEFMEMPFMKEGERLYCGEISYLVELVNEKMKKIFRGIEKFEEKIGKIY
ncbi:hypothetical protein J4437_04050 [Candidatus Woesearchaeota archaeon]|nr:hypothetical protein [uncultured archaeon]MBS3123783.1 hypothetical protein [Candidatus Woesearchaeota archaeon]